MLDVAYFTFNSFYENTYILSNDEGACWIIDPGCSTDKENNVLHDFIKKKNLIPTRLLLTHAHIDHILGTKFIFDTFNLEPEMHPNEKIIWDNAQMGANMFGIRLGELPPASFLLSEATEINLGSNIFEIRFVPGHSPGSICFIQHDKKIVISGDVLFQGSVGRSDLPGGNHDVLIHSIKSQLLTLDDDYKVFSGHGIETTIGAERKYNPFLRAY